MIENRENPVALLVRKNYHEGGSPFSSSRGLSREPERRLGSLVGLRLLSKTVRYSFMLSSRLIFTSYTLRHVRTQRTPPCARDL